MHGWMFSVLEHFVLEKHGGSETWQAIKAKAGCRVEDGGFLARSVYPDSLLTDLVGAAADILAVPASTILDLFGHYFGYWIIHRNGSADMLECQGTSLRSWLSNLNAMHDHIQMNFPGGSGKQSKFLPPVFWCEDCDVKDADESDQEDSILLHYYSSRGTVFVPLVPGIVQELSMWRFDLEVEFTLLNTQGKGHDYTSWRITAVEEDDSWKLTGQGNSPDYMMADRSNRLHTRHTTNSAIQMDARRRRSTIQSSIARCPFTGLKRATLVFSEDDDSDSDSTDTDYPRNKPLIEDDSELQRLYDFQDRNDAKLATLGISVAQMESIFPFHIIIDQSFTILNVGNSLPTVLARDKTEFLGRHIGELLQISRPVLEDWNWKALHKVADQSFFLVPSWHMDCSLASNEGTIEFKGSLFAIGTEDAVMLALSPNIRNVEELKNMGLCMTDLPLHGCQRDTVFLGEYITQEVEKAHDLDVLSRQLALEKDVSNTLLHNMLPEEVAEELRNGGVVSPKHYENVTLFFSDVVGFTAMCDQVEPWDVIDMLNQLYCVMDFLAERFDIYKVETIGDAYMACSGLPHTDNYHAENIANFAIAVIECVKLVKSPVDDETPLQLRIGIHTGECTAGVVGTMTPHYCLFGDMVNVSARHEQTGSPGRIQSSSELYGRLHHDSPFDKEQFQLTPRGLIDMKGKGQRYTYWLERGTNNNEHTNPTALAALKVEVNEVLRSKTWKIRKYFSGASGAFSRRDANSSITGGSTDLLSDSTAQLTRTEVASEDGNKTAEVDNTEHEKTPSESTDRDLDDFATHKTNGSNNHHDNPHHHNQQHPKGHDCCFEELVFPEQSREELVLKVCDILYPLLKLCMLDHASETAPVSADVLCDQLLGFIYRISEEFRPQNAYHSFRRTVHVVAWSNHLFERLQDSDAGHSGKLDPGPWYRLALTLAALIRDCRHLGVTDEQLQKEGHSIFQMHGARSCQAKHSLTFGLDLLEEEFPDLYRELRWGCPSFLFLLRKAALASDPIGDFQASMKLPISSSCPQDMAQRTEATLALVTKLADLGYFTLKYENFKGWMDALFAERRLASLAHRGDNPVLSWNDDCIRLCRDEVLPLVRLCQASFPGACSLEETVLSNLKALSKENDDAFKKGLFPRRRPNRENIPLDMEDLTDDEK